MILSGAGPREAFRCAVLAGVAILSTLGSAPAQEAGSKGGSTTSKAAIFPVELNDPTLPYGRKPPPAQLKRLDLATGELRRILSDRGRIESVDLAPQRDEIDRQAPLYKCNGCTSDIAKALGADLAVTAVAEKGSMQVFNLTVTIAHAATGRVVRQGQVVISANTDDDWTHAARSVVNNRLLAEPLPGRS